VAGLAAMAAANPTFLQETAVDMGDGTYTVQFYRIGLDPLYMRVSNVMDMCRAQLPASHSIWALVLEKAFCYIRGGVNSYASLWGGVGTEAFYAFANKGTSINPTGVADDTLYTQLSDALSNGQGVTLDCNGPGGLVVDHTYTLLSVYTDSDGAHHYVVRNPWGPGHYASVLENFDGIADLTYDQFEANFTQGAICS
jgi:hypothetical protein